MNGGAVFEPKGQPDPGSLGIGEDFLEEEASKLGFDCRQVSQERGGAGWKEFQEEGTMWVKAS